MPSKSPASLPALAQKSAKAKLDEVTRLLDTLRADLKEINLLPHQRDAALEDLKVYGRDPKDADPIFTKEGIETLSRHAFNSPSFTTSRNALKCLANALLLRSETRQILVDMGYDAKLCSRLKNENLEDEFLISRITFLLTYDTNVDLEKLIDQHNLAENINTNIQRHAKHYPAKGKKPKADPMEDMALTETLKLLFNITHFCQDRIHTFLPSIPHILTILCRHAIVPKTPLDPPMGALVNSLINFEYEEGSEQTAFLFPKFDPKCNAERLVQLLDLAIRTYQEEDLEKELVPPLTLIRKIYEVAPGDIKTFLGQKLLPSDEDRKTPLGKNESLSSCLLRLSSSPIAPQLREAISNLLFDLSNKDAASFVQNVGYGFASGFLFQHNLPIPENALEAWSSSGNGEESTAKGSQDQEEWEEQMRKMKLVNPITGQLLEKETPHTGPEMTPAEKEREAERLMVLFERLKKNGVMTAEHPMRQMQQEGRFEELRDDDDDDDSE